MNLKQLRSFKPGQRFLIGGEVATLDCIDKVVYYRLSTHYDSGAGCVSTHTEGSLLASKAIPIPAGATENQIKALKHLHEHR